MKKTAKKKPRYGASGKKDVMKTLFFNEDDIELHYDGDVVRRNAREYLTKEDFRYMDNEAYDFFVSFTKLNPRLKGYFDYYGINILNFVEEEFYVKSVFFYTVKDIIRTIGTVMKVIDVEEPYKLIVRDNASMKNNVALVTAKAMGLKTAVKSCGCMKRARNLIKSDLMSFGYETFLKMQKSMRRLSQKKIESKKHVLFLPYYANHADVMNPVIRLMKQKNMQLDVVCVDNVFNVTKKRLKRYGIDYEEFEHYSSSKVMDKVRIHKIESGIYWRKLKKDIEAQNAISYRKIPLWPILKPRLKFLFMRRFAQVAEYIETTRNIISVKKPSIIVIANDTSTYGRVAASVAQLENVPCLLLQHGAIADEPKYSRIFADRMAVEGPEVKRFFVGKGLPAEKFIVTGQPRYDLLAKKEGIPQREEMCRSLGIDAKKRIIVLATQVPECNDKVVRAVYDAVKDMKDAMLVVKLHPAERTDAIYQKVRKETGMKNIIIGKDINLYGLLDACELMMTVFSTTAMEAMMLDRAVITINLTGEPDLMPYASSGAAIGVYKAENLKRAIENALNDEKTKEMLKKNREKFVYGLVYRMDGKASERVLALIKETAKRRS